jgi:hypothetical protein
MRIIAAAVAVAMLAGCATAPVTYRPIIDPAFGDMARYEESLGECQRFADQVRVGERAAAGAIAGAIFGVALGVMFGLRGQALAQVAGAGAVAAGSNTAAYAGLSQVQIVQRCMSNRGYAVLG